MIRVPIIRIVDLESELAAPWLPGGADPLATEAVVFCRDTGAIFIVNGASLTRRVLTDVDKGVSGGVATLDGTSLVPIAELAANAGSSNMSLGQDRIWHKRTMTGDVSVDFGFWDTDASVTVTGLGWVVSGTNVIANISPVPSADHGPEDAMLEELHIVAMSIVPGIGFDLVVHAPSGASGIFNLVWMGI